MFDQFQLHSYNFSTNITSSSLPSVVAPRTILIPSFPIHPVGRPINAVNHCFNHFHLSKDLT